MIQELLDERTKRILNAVIQSYISKPEPVGSRFVTKRYSLGFSPATIRNIMADLSDLGFLSQPHTSAGRVPTDKAYRFYVDSLLSVVTERECEEVTRDFINNFRKKLENLRSDVNMMFAEITDTLSSLSSYVGVALPPKTDKTTFKRIDLIRYKDDYVAAVLLTEEGVIKNRIFHVEIPLTQGDLNRIADYLNGEFSGHTLDEIRGVLVMRMSQEKDMWDNLISRAIMICQYALSFAEDDLFVSGLYDVMNLPDFSDISRIRNLTRAIKEKHIILNVLAELSQTKGVHVVIGDENPAAELKKLSIVASTYSESGRPIGIVALIGPTRMDYSRAIHMVDTIAQCVSNAFRGG